MYDYINIILKVKFTLSIYLSKPFEINTRKSLAHVDDVTQAKGPATWLGSWKRLSDIIDFHYTIKDPPNMASLRSPKVANSRVQACKVSLVWLTMSTSSAMSYQFTLT